MQRDAPSGTIETTMLELVGALAEELDDDREIVTAVCSLLQSGRLRLIGTFRDSRMNAMVGFDLKPPPQPTAPSRLDRWPAPGRFGRARHRVRPH
jgi:hypothetical protein